MSDTSARLQVILLEPDRLVADAVSQILQNEQDISLVEVARTSEEAIELLNSSDAHLVICRPRTALHGKDSLVPRLEQANLACQILLIVRRLDKDRWSSEFESGVAGWVPRNLAPESLPSAIRAIAAGGCWLDHEGMTQIHAQNRQLTAENQELAARNQELEKKLARYEGPLSRLNQREYGILLDLMEHLPNREIAKRHNLSEHTVKGYVSSILAKLGASDREEAADLGRKYGATRNPL